ncbi:cyclase family protein [Clostridium tetani]|uniref:cyclase family protein n=1 Tax=Clostridium tetani TaxID=1513 RepID=UPI0003C0D048|nr:cyclase family protein [Clostridium tetani]CDI50044.1 polyketide cyclase [Clostridium tetani 12124569]
MIIDLTTKVSQEEIEEWLNTKENKYIASGHIGTHLDTYLKSSIPLEYFKCKGVLIDVSQIASKREVEIKDVKHVDIPQNSFILFRTAQIEKYRYGSKEYFYNHPQLSHELINYLINKKVNFIGIDCAGIRRGEEHGPADILCEENGIYVIENLCELNKIASSNFTVYTMWLDDSIATGLKCRVIVEQ